MCQHLTNAINNEAKINLKAIKRYTKTNMKRNKLGYDNDCKTLKQHTLSLGKLVTKFAQKNHNLW